MKKVIAAMDSFKGSLTSREANAAVVAALDGKAEVRTVAMSDGGEGMLDAVADATGAGMEEVSIHDLMMRRRTARYAVVPDGTVVIEVAEAVGLTLLKPEERHPMRATSYGVGELIAAAVRRGGRRFVVGLGGSGTSDAGIGMLRALVDSFGKRQPSGAVDGGIDAVLRGSALAECSFTIATDVGNPLLGADGAAAVFAPQKGATPEMVEQLEERARRFADFSARHYGRDLSAEPGAGAAGGLGYAFLQYLGARRESGAGLMLRLARFDAMLRDADLVITGEGSADRQTLMGKMPACVLEAARRRGVPVWLVAGRVADRGALLQAGFGRVEQITPQGMPLSEAMRKEVARENLSNHLHITFSALPSALNM